tara:strand:+ start:9126 stop:22271 length:13146 start_codon:yes stop_codon:yes gene_type:complete
MATIECKIDLIPPQNNYEELYTSNNNNNNKVYKCRSGYKTNPDINSIIIRDSPDATPCSTVLSTPTLRCNKESFYMPYIIRPDNSTNFQCSTDPTKENPSPAQIKQCLLENTKHDINSLRKECNKVNGCSFQRYKGDYFKKEDKYEYGQKTDKSSWKIISFEEANKLFPRAARNAQDDGPNETLCWPEASVPRFNNMQYINDSKTTDQIKDETIDYRCINLNHISLKTPTSLPDPPISDNKEWTIDNFERGELNSDMYYPWYIPNMGYTISKDGNPYIGTSIYDTIKNIDGGHKNSIANNETNQYYPGGIPTESITDFTYTCNNDSFFDGNVVAEGDNNNIFYGDPTINMLNLTGCRMNKCEMNSNNDNEGIYKNRFISIYELDESAISTPPTCDSSIAGKDGQSFYTCKANLEQFGIYKGDGCQGNIIGDIKDYNISELQCNYCGALESKDDCNNNDRCYWFQSAGESLSECRNKCKSRETLGDCEQFYKGNDFLLSDTLYDFDGRDNRCTWIPDYINSDTSESSTEGTCRDKSTPCFPTTNVENGGPCNIQIPSRSSPLRGTAYNKRCYLNQSEIELYMDDPYCGKNSINKYEETCGIKEHSECYLDNCKQASIPYKCISDGEPYIDGKNTKVYKSDSECSQYTSPTECANEKGCMTISNRDICKAKSIRELLESKNYDVSSLKDVCKPLKAQVPVNYDPNLLEEEDIDLASYSENHNVDTPFITSRYLCDICSIRDKDIKEIEDRQNKKGINDNYYIKPEQFNKQEYCENSIDMYNKLEDISPCIFRDNKCISRCKHATESITSESLSKHNIKQAKDICNQTLQFSESPRHDIKFPNISDDIDEDYYKDMYCSWDGFECHNSIPCKEAQRTRCEDLGYDWYVGTAENIADQKNELSGDNNDILSVDPPIKHKGDGKPIMGDSQGICIFPNTDSTFIGAPAEYRIKDIFKGHQGIVLRWKEFGTDWTRDHSLNRRFKGNAGNTRGDMSNCVIDSISKLTGINDLKPYNYNTHIEDKDLGDNLIFIPLDIKGNETDSEIMDKINISLRSYEYYAMNGDYIVSAKTILEWTNENYMDLWYKNGRITPPGDSETRSSKIYNYGGYLYYKTGYVEGEDMHKLSDESSATSTDGSDGTISDNSEDFSGLIKNRRLKDDVMMCNVIYDLRGIINIIPVINGHALLEIHEYKINPGTGGITFKMYPKDPKLDQNFSIETYQRFQFISFIGPEIFDNEETKSEEQIIMYRRKTMLDGILDPRQIHTENPATSNYDMDGGNITYIKVDASLTINENKEFIIWSLGQVTSYRFTLDSRTYTSQELKDTLNKKIKDADQRTNLELPDERINDISIYKVDGNLLPIITYTDGRTYLNPSFGEGDLDSNGSASDSDLGYLWKYGDTSEQIDNDKNNANENRKKWAGYNQNIFSYPYYFQDASGFGGYQVNPMSGTVHTMYLRPGAIVLENDQPVAEWQAGNQNLSVDDWNASRGDEQGSHGILGIIGVVTKDLSTEGESTNVEVIWLDRNSLTRARVRREGLIIINRDYIETSNRVLLASIWRSGVDANADADTNSKWTEILTRPPPIPTVKGGYGSLYEPFISESDYMYCIGNISADNLTPGDIRRYINPNYLDYSVKYDKYKNINSETFSLKGVYYIDKQGYTGESNDNYLTKCSGSYESFKFKILSGIGGVSDDLNSLRKKVSLTNNPIMNLLRTYSDNKNMEEVDRKIIPNDIRKGLLWSMTRPVHPAFGDLIYDPGNSSIKSLINDGTNKTDIKGVNLPFLGVNNQRREAQVYNIYKKHLLDPFGGKTQDDIQTEVSGNEFDNFVNWNNLLGYMGGNYNKIILYKDLPAPTPKNGWWDDENESWNTDLNQILENNRNNKYYKRNYYNYIYLTPNNSEFDDAQRNNIDDEIITNENKDKLVQNNATPNINILAFIHVADSGEDNYLQYYHPGKWVDPPSPSSWPTSTSAPGGFGDWSKPSVVDPSGRLIGETNRELQRLKQLFGNNLSSEDINLQPIPSILGDIQKDKYFNISYPDGTGDIGNLTQDNTHPHRKPGELLSEKQHGAWPSNSLLYGENCSKLSKYMDNIWVSKEEIPETAAVWNYTLKQDADWQAGTDTPIKIGCDHNTLFNTNQWPQKYGPWCRAGNIKIPAKHWYQNDVYPCDCISWSLTPYEPGSVSYTTLGNKIRDSTVDTGYTERPSALPGFDNLANNEAEWNRLKEYIDKTIKSPSNINQFASLQGLKDYWHDRCKIPVDIRDQKTNYEQLNTKIFNISDPGRTFKAVSEIHDGQQRPFRFINAPALYPFGFPINSPSPIDLLKFDTTPDNVLKGSELEKVPQLISFGIPPLPGGTGYSIEGEVGLHEGFTATAEDLTSLLVEEEDDENIRFSGDFSDTSSFNCPTGTPALSPPPYRGFNADWAERLNRQGDIPLVGDSMEDTDGDTLVAVDINKFGQRNTIDERLAPYWVDPSATPRYCPPIKGKCIGEDGPTSYAKRIGVETRDICRNFCDIHPDCMGYTYSYPNNGTCVMHGSGFVVDDVWTIKEETASKITDVGAGSEYLQELNTNFANLYGAETAAALEESWICSTVKGWVEPEEIINELKYEVKTAEYMRGGHWQNPRILKDQLASMNGGLSPDELLSPEQGESTLHDYYDTSNQKDTYPVWLNIPKIILPDMAQQPESIYKDNGTCGALLNYVPNTTTQPTTTINRISLDNCSLPLLDKKGANNKQTWNTNLVYNTMENFKETTSDLTIRDICPHLCQTQYKPPGVSPDNINTFTVPPTEPGTSVMESSSILSNVLYDIDDPSLNSLWKIPIKTDWQGKTQSIMFPKYLNGENPWRSYYIRIKSRSSESKVLKHLLTNTGKETLHTFYLPPSPPPPTGLSTCPTDNKPTECISKMDSEGVLSTGELVENISNYNCRNAILRIIDAECLQDPASASPTGFINCINKGSHADIIKQYCTGDDEPIIQSTSPSPSNSIYAIYSVKQDRLDPWINLSQESEPANFLGRVKNVPTEYNPYETDNNCSVATDPLVTFKKINPIDKLEFFKPRYGAQGISHIFKPMKISDDKDYGCIREDIMNVTDDFFDLSCNTNSVYNIERDKFVLINLIIEESIKKGESDSLNTSDRTKLVLMDEEELINKAINLKLDLKRINEYTKPRLVSKVKDIYDLDNKRFEKWNDLENIYLNIEDNEHPDYIPKLGVKEWDFVGCGIDHNNIDKTKSFPLCKDKYPGLCGKNKSLCNSLDNKVRLAIIKDCPETCSSQLDNLTDFESRQLGDLSICTGQGRCRSVIDEDASNLLPVCEETSVREFGDNDKCKNFKNVSTGSCQSGDDSEWCDRYRCKSMIGCEYSEKVPRQCIFRNYIDHDLNFRECSDYNGIWVGRESSSGACKIPEYIDNKYTNKLECNTAGGVFIDEKESSCTYNSTNWLPLEDPCKLPYNDDLNKMKKEDIEKKYNELLGGKSLKILDLKPECLSGDEDCKQGKTHPNVFKLTVDDASDIKIGNYININYDDFGDSCQPYILGYSVVLDVRSKKYIYIKGPSQSYLLEQDPLNKNKYDIGDNCKIDQVYSAKGSSSDNEDKDKQQCISKDRTNGSCTYIESEDPEYQSGECKSCSLITTRNECVDKNYTSSCGWGEIRDICESIGDIGECNDMYIEGCYWDKSREMCLLNEMRREQGCMKCNDIKHKNTCDTLSNCYFERRESRLTGGQREVSVNEFHGTSLGECRSCSDAFPGEGKINDSSMKDMAEKCNTLSSGKCQWRNDIGSDVFRCRAAKPYPFIYEWVWYNKILLACIIITIYIWYKTPFKAGGYLKTFLLVLFKLYILITVISCFLFYPGVTRADGYSECSNGKNTKNNPEYTKEKCISEGNKWNVIRNYYYQPPPSKNDYFSFLRDLFLEETSDPDKNPGAQWPTNLYDSNWDDKIMDNTVLRSIVDLELWPNSLNWSEYLLWKPIRGWNYLMNANQDSSLLFITGISFFTLVGLYGLTLGISLKEVNNKNLRQQIKNMEGIRIYSTILTLVITILSITILVYLYILRKSYHKAIIESDNQLYSDHKNKNQTSKPTEINKKTNLVKYYGRQEKEPIDNSIWNLLYSTKKKDKSGNNIHVCPVGCRLNVSRDLGNMPSSGMINFAGTDYNIFPTPVDYPACGDTRSLFSFTNSTLYPDAKLDIEEYDHTEPTSRQRWKYYDGVTGVGYICPPKQRYTKWPYDSICRDERNICKSSKDFKIIDPGNNHGHPESTPPTAGRYTIGDKDTPIPPGFKDKLDGICEINRQKYGRCDNYDDSDSLKPTLSIDGYKEGVKNTIIGVNCSYPTGSNSNSSCPFPEETTYSSGSEEITRQPIKLWQYMFDGIFNTSPSEPVPRRLSKARKLNWQNQVRYDIVDQNYFKDRPN